MCAIPSNDAVTTGNTEVTSSVTVTLPGSDGPPMIGDIGGLGSAASGLLPTCYIPISIALLLCGLLFSLLSWI